jgi:hypothetical protein
MNARTTFHRLRTVASCALISSALVGTFLLFWPIATSFVALFNVFGDF